MKIPEELKNKIIQESTSFKENLFQKEGIDEYGLKPGEKGDRDALGQFFTPPVLVIQMLEMFDCTLEEFSKKTILDPTCGSGNLIMGALIVGSSINPKYPEMVYGNEFAEPPLNICRKRFTNYCKENGLEGYTEDFWKWHLHQGDALRPECIKFESFTPKYKFLESEIKNEVYEKLAGNLKSQYIPDEVVLQKKGLLNVKKVVKTWKLKK